MFLNKCLNFLGLGLAIYGLANLYECFSPGAIFKHTTSCQFCMKEVSPTVSQEYHVTVTDVEIY